MLGIKINEAVARRRSETNRLMFLPSHSPLMRSSDNRLLCSSALRTFVAQTASPIPRRSDIADKAVEIAVKELTKWARVRPLGIS